MIWVLNKVLIGWWNNGIKIQYFTWTIFNFLFQCVVVTFGCFTVFESEKNVRIFQSFSLIWQFYSCFLHSCFLQPVFFLSVQIRRRLKSLMIDQLTLEGPSRASWPGRSADWAGNDETAAGGAFRTVYWTQYTWSESQQCKKHMVRRGTEACTEQTHSLTSTIQQHRERIGKVYEAELHSRDRTRTNAAL